MRFIKTLLISLITTLSFSQYSIPTNHFFVSKFASSFDIQYNKAPTWPRIELNQSWDLITLKESYQVYPYKKGYGTNVSNGQTDKIVYEGTKLPSSFYFEDKNPFRNNDRMAVIQSLLQNNQDYFDTYIEFASFIFKKSDISPFTFQITFNSSDEKRTSIGRYEKELKDKYKDVNNGDINLMGRILNDSLLINERRNLRWSGLKSTKFIFDNDPNTLVSISENVYSKPIEFDPQHELIKKIKSSSTVTVLIERENYQPTYLKIDLTGSSRVISQVLKDMTPSDKNIFEYRYYMGLANMNPFDYEGYIYKFLEDSKKNHDLNLDYIKNTKIFTISKNLEEGTIAESLSMNDENSVIIQIDPYQWRNASQVKRWYIIYHELGHDILNLEHGECGRMMDAFAKKDYTWEEFEEDKKVMFEKYKEQR